MLADGTCPLEANAKTRWTLLSWTSQKPSTQDTMGTSAQTSAVCGSRHGLIVIHGWRVSAPRNVTSSASKASRPSTTILKQVLANPNIGTPLSKTSRGAIILPTSARRPAAHLDSFVETSVAAMVNVSAMPTWSWSDQFWSMAQSYGACPSRMTSTGLKKMQNYGLRQWSSSLEITGLSTISGSITKLHLSNLPPLQESQRHLWLVLSYMGVEGLVPALPSGNFHTPQKPGRLAWTRREVDLTPPTQ